MDLTAKTIMHEKNASIFKKIIINMIIFGLNKYEFKYQNKLVLVTGGTNYRKRNYKNFFLKDVS